MAGLRVRHLTLTTMPHTPAASSLPELQAAWKRFAQRLRSAGLLGHYWATVELTPGRLLPHLHILLCDRWLAAQAPRDSPERGVVLGGRLPHGPHEPLRPLADQCGRTVVDTHGRVVRVTPLAAHAWECGFGYVLDVREVRFDPHADPANADAITMIAAYLSKPEHQVSDADVWEHLWSFNADAPRPNEVDYVSGVSYNKALMITSAYRGWLDELGAERIRPYRASQGWPGGKLTEIERAIRTEGANRRGVSEEPGGWRMYYEGQLARELAAARAARDGLPAPPPAPHPAQLRLPFASARGMRLRAVPVEEASVSAATPLECARMARPSP